MRQVRLRPILRDKLIGAQYVSNEDPQLTDHQPIGCLVSIYVKAARAVPDSEMFTLSEGALFMRRQASFPFTDLKCLPIYFIFPIHYHYGQASQTVTFWLMFRVRCNCSYIFNFFYYYKAQALSISTINTMWCCGRVV